MNITQSGLISSSRLDFTSSSLYTRASGTGTSFMPTRDEIKSNHETDKQNEDNTTWFLEYKALLNSKLTTLITSLTNAYTTDLDSAMGVPISTLPWAPSGSMQGKTGGDTLDPGAMRTSYSYLLSFSSGLSPTDSAWFSSTTNSASHNIDYGGPAGNVTNAMSGTTTFVTSSIFELDRLEVNVSVLNQFSNSSLPTYIVTKADKPSIDTEYKNKKIGNNFLLTLYKFFERPENIDLLKFDMFKDVYVVGTSSLPTGSQVQGSLSLNWIPGNGHISIKQERFAAFYHS